MFRTVIGQDQLIMRKEMSLVKAVIHLRLVSSEQLYFPGFMKIHLVSLKSPHKSNEYKEVHKVGSKM